MRLPPKVPPQNPFWQFFSVERASRTPTATAWLVGNFVNATLGTPATHRDLVNFVCASAHRPIPVISLSERLSDISLLRGRSCFSMPGKLLDEVARAHEDMGWWVTDEGLYMEVIPPTNKVAELNALDRLAGSLAAEKWDDSHPRKNTKLSAESLLAIAIALDKMNFRLIDMLQPKECTTLKDRNQRAGRAGIHSFEELANSRHSRMLRRHLSVARRKYIKAASMTREPFAIPREFWSVNPIAC